ncbi:putative late blight resistance protein homolog R1A-3 [Coffea arabica]|uniref:Late blight resistance protein homolog R1A-3 n=1 Tax=Coffea arabica TaxID=13443 RepID=A0A6P6V455_COFAR|nr:putative late blight resistance protein homolog R1A-3 [Coffea arabica]
MVVHTCVDSAIEQLSKLLALSRLTSTNMENQIKGLLLELKFVKMFFCCLETFTAADDQETMRDGSIELKRAQATLEAASSELYQAGFFASFGLDIEDWQTLVSNLLQIVKGFKPEVRNICSGVVVNHSWNSKSKLSYTNEEILEFTDSILVNLERLLSVVTGENIVPDVKKQMEALAAKLKFTRDFLDFTIKRRGRSYDELEDFLTMFHAWTKTAACLSLLYWVEVDSTDENMAHWMNAMLSARVQEIMPSTPSDVQMYLGLLKSSKISRGDALLVDDIIARFVGFLPLENLVDCVERDDIVAVRDGLIFLISFLMDAPKESQSGAARRTVFLKPIEAARRKAFLRKIEAAISKLTNLIFLRDNSFIPWFLEKILKIMIQAKKHHVRMPKSSASNCPKTDGRGFVHSLLINLEEMMKSNAANFILFAKHKVAAIHRELHSLSLMLKDIMDLQNEHKSQELNGFWAQTIDVAYRAEGVIRACSIVDRPIWYHLICLSDVLEGIKVIKTTVEKKVKREEHTSSNRSSTSSAETSVNRIPLSSRTYSFGSYEVLGFNDEADAVINLLKRGSNELSVVSIVGMPGVGKTTLARIAYNDPSVQLHFHKLAWCPVSETYRSRDLLLDIVNCITSVEDVDLYDMSDEDLTDLIRKSLLRQRYLVVIDDIWEMGAWDSIRQSLPRDRNGSRIVLTSQNHNLALQTGLAYNTHLLSPFTDEKSWKYLEEMLFHTHGCPDNLLDVAKKIARKCKGLPLAIVAILALLQKEERNLDIWGRIEENSNPGIASKGYREILERSYKHLPDHLKPCFLYFGAFQAGKAISAQKLTLLWVAEGFMRTTEMGGMESLEVLANDYLMELINRSLVDVTERSSDGGIKACRLNDLLHDFCLEKAQEDKFLHIDWSDISHGSSSRVKHYPYRLSIHSKWETFGKPKPVGQYLYSLLVSSEIRRNQSYLKSVAFQYFHSFKLLHILNLEGIYLDLSFPEVIISMVHLRYLAIQGSFTAIPSSIANLWNLRSIAVKGLQPLICLPETIWTMRNLKHVHASENAVISLDDLELEYSSMLVSNMKTFSTLALHHVADPEKVLRRLSGLQKLKCIVSLSQLCCDNENQFPALAYLENLQALTLYTLGYEGLASCSWMQNQFHTFAFPSTLKKLTVYKLGLPWRAMSIIRQLPKLEVLKLREEAFRGKRWDMTPEEEEFCNLKYLELSNLNLRQWSVAYDPFPCLEQLVVGDCYRLVEIPHCFERVTTLQMIELCRCSDRVKSSAEVILKEQRDWGNYELELLISDS